MKKILIGTHNNGKFKEISALISKDFKKFSPIDKKISSPKETGKTFFENSRLKANYFCKHSKMISISSIDNKRGDALIGTALDDFSMTEKGQKSSSEGSGGSSGSSGGDTGGGCG